MLLAPTVTLLLLGRMDSSAADAARVQAAQRKAHAHALAVSAHVTEQRSQRIASASRDVFSDLKAVEDEMQDAIAAQNRLAGISNQTASLFNEGQISASQSLMKTAGQAALTNLTTKTAAAHRAVVALQQAMTQLKEALDA
jgi:hypothetical protein